MNLILALCVLLSGYGIGYDGTEEDKHYFHVSTPTNDYGFVLDDSGVYCDLVSHK